MSEELLSAFYPLSEVEKLAKAGLASFPEQPGEGELILRRDVFLRKGKLIDIRVNYRFFDAPRHSHDFIEMAYVLHGSLTHEIEGKKVVMNEGDLLIMNRNAHHAVERCGQEDIMINFIVLPEFFERAIKQAELEESPMQRFFISCILDADNTPDYLLFNVKDILPLRHLVENMLWSIKNDVPYKQTTNQLTMALLLRLLQYHAGYAQSNEAGYGLIWQVQQYIDSHYRDGSLEDAARLLHYDYRWLSHEIARKTDKTFTQLLQERRMQQALYLLKNTDFPIQNVCVQVGYSNNTFFYKLFKETYGVTPKKYREAFSRNCVSPDRQPPGNRAKEA